MQKSIEQIAAEFDAAIAEFDAVMRRLNSPVREQVESSPAYRVAKIIPFPTRETLQ